MNQEQSDQFFEKLKEKLDLEHQWPSIYMFKFIVPSEKVNEVKGLFPKHEVSTKPSSKGTYISVTAKVMIPNSEEVIKTYKEAKKIEGLIAL